MISGTDIKAWEDVTLEHIRQYVEQCLHGFAQDPAGTDFERGYQAAIEDFAKFFNIV